jgi:hypothetical protein
MTHSPAPWKWQRIHHDYDPPNFDRNTLIDDKGYNIIMPCNNNPYDLALIAAAPDLLAALKVFVDRFEDCEDASDGEGESWQSSELSDMIKVAKAAISKAEPNEIT